MTDPTGADDRGSKRWQWVGADPDDMSEDARFRRRVAALAREVMLARGAAPDEAPPVARTRGASEPDPVTGRPVSGATGSPDYFDIHSGAPYLLSLAGRTVVSTLEGSGSPTGVATTDLVLLTVARSPRGTTMKQLATTLGVPPSTVSVAARRLVDRGWAARRRSTRDRRRIILVATAAGLTAAERMAASWRQTNDRLLDVLTVTERDELCRLLRRAVSALAARRPSG